MAVVALKDYLYWLRPKAGDTAPTDQKAGVTLTGGTVTLVDAGGGDYCWRVSGGPSVAAVPANVDPTATAGGVTLALRYSAETYDSSVFAVLFGWGMDSTPGSSSSDQALSIGQNGNATGSLRARWNSGNTDTLNFTSSIAANTVRTMILRFTVNASGSTDQIHVWLNGGANHSGGAVEPDYVGTGSAQATAAALVAIFFGSANSVLRGFDIVGWGGELSKADCTALADVGIRATLDALPAAPTFTGPNIGTISGTAGVAITPIDVSGKFTATGTRTYSKIGAWPSWLLLDSATSIISGTPTTSEAVSGLSVRLTTAGGAVDSNTFSTSIAAAPDTTAPTLSSPSGAATNPTAATLSVTTNEGNGTVYGIVSTSASATAAAVKAGAGAVWAGSAAVSSAGVKTLNATGLSALATYFAHFVHTDAAGNDSSIASSASFATPAAGDTTPPTLSGASGAATGATTATGSVTTTEANGTLYVVATTSSTPPTTAQVKAGQNASGVTAPSANAAVSATGVRTLSLTGLVGNTTYWLHFVHRDAAGNDSAVASITTSFTTDAPSANPTATIGPLMNWVLDTPLVGEAVAQVKLIKLADNLLKASASNKVTNASGLFTVSDAALELGAAYMAFYYSADGTLAGWQKVVAA